MGEGGGKDKAKAVGGVNSGKSGGGFLWVVECESATGRQGLCGVREGGRVPWCAVCASG